MINVDGRPLTIIGVLTKEFRLFAGSRPYDIWRPYDYESAASRWDDNSVLVFGRLKRGIGIATARNEMDALGRQISAEHPQAVGRPSVLPLQESNIGDARATLALLSMAVALVLLVACANVANLLLTRTSGRRREIAIRLAVGASRERILRQWLTESLVISLAGCAGGLWFSALAKLAYGWPSVRAGVM